MARVSSTPSESAKISVGQIWRNVDQDRTAEHFILVKTGHTKTGYSGGDKTTVNMFCLEDGDVWDIDGVDVVDPANITEAEFAELCNPFREEFSLATDTLHISN